MVLNRTDAARWRWGDAAKSGLIGGMIAVAAPLCLAVYLGFQMEDKYLEGVGMLAMVAILAAPIMFALGAVGGLLAYAARGRPTQAPVDVRGMEAPSFDVWRMRLRHAGWLIGGGLAGYAASAVTSFNWPIIGGYLIGFALIPIWICIGAALGDRVAVSRTPDRPLIGGVLTAGAASVLISALPGLVWPGHDQHTVVRVIGSALIGVFAIHRLHAEQSPV